MCILGVNRFTMKEKNMDINLNNLGPGNVGYGRESLGTAGVGAGHETKGVPQTSRTESFHVSSPFSHAQSIGLASSEPVANVPEVALSRDDDLGKLVCAAFNLAPPPMPNFS